MSEAPIVFQFHSVTGELIGTSYADTDPMEPERWVVPASATLTAPPEPATGFARVFANQAWQQVEDHRGETWWKGDGEAVIISFLGDPAGQGMSATEPEPEPVDPTSFPLSRLTFWLAAAHIGVTKAGIRAHIDAMPEGVGKYQALVYLEEAQVYRREDPLLIQMAAAEGITETELDALWSWAAQTYP